MGDQERIELIRNAWDAFGRRDLPWLLEVYTPDAELKTATATGVEGEARQGLEGAKATYEDLWETWERFEGRPEQFLCIGDHMLVVIQAEMVGRRSGITLSQYFWQLFSFEGTKIRRHYSFSTARPALEEMARLVS